MEWMGIWEKVIIRGEGLIFELEMRLERNRGKESGGGGGGIGRYWGKLRPVGSTAAHHNLT